MKVDKKGFSLLLVILIVVIASLAGLVGWLVWDRAQNNKVVSTSEANNKNATKPAKSTVPTGYSEYKNQEYGIEFIYPTNWGTDKLSTEDGYSKYIYNQNLKPDGVSAWTITFSDSSGTSIQMYSTTYINAPHGGNTTYGVIGYCQVDGGYAFKRRQSSSSDPLQISGSVCDQDKLKSYNLVKESLLATGVEMCNEGGCDGQKNILVVPVEGKDIKSVLVLRDEEITNDFTDNFVNNLSIN